MKISVPVIRRTDVLVTGGMPEGIQTAIELKKSGRSVFCVSELPYFGGAVCAHLDYQSPKSEAWKRFFPGDALRTPTDVKYTLEHALMDSNIDFLFQAWPVAPVYDEKNIFAGILFADRSGFQIVACRAVLDATERALAARVCGVPMKKFVPGVRTAVRYQTGAANGNNVEKLPLSYKDERNGEDIPVFRISEKFDVPEANPTVLAEIETRLRLLAWHPEMTAASDSCVLDLGDGPEEAWKPTEELPVAIAGKISAAELGKIVGKTNPGKPAGFRLSSVNNAFEIVRKDRFFRFGNAGSVELDLDSFTENEHYDVLIVGGGTAGAPAAIASGRAGAKTLCIETLSDLGGIMTLGRIPYYYFGNRVGFTKELDDELLKFGNPKFNIKLGHADPEWKKEFFLLESDRAGAEVRFNTIAVASVVKKGTKTLCGVLSAGPFGIRVITADALVDASGNSDVAAFAGAETVVCSPLEPSVQGAGMSPIRPGEEYANTDYLFVCDHDILDTTRSFVMGRAKFRRSFDLIQIQNTRERRRIIGDLTLQPQDFYANRCYSDTINIASSNFDTHGYIVHPLFMLQAPTHEEHSAKVPFRALLPRGVENVLVTGLSISAHRDCMPLIRMQPDVQNQGYAAGIAAAMISKTKTVYRKIDMRSLQKALIEKNILPPEILNENDSIPGVPATDSHYELASLFINPEKSRVSLLKKFRETPDVRTAELLAFFGNGEGRAMLAEKVKNTPWDEGWDFRGMGQFGLSVSALDCTIFALTSAGGDPDAILSKLSDLCPDDAFSHFRSVCFALTRRPDHRAAGMLEDLLRTPGMKGYSIGTLRSTILANRRKVNDTSYRNSQLKEFYLAKALAACDDGNALAREILNSYRNGLMGTFSLYA